MFTKVSTRITSSLLRAEIINEPEKDVYTYGFRRLFTFLLNLATAFMIGIIMGQLWECLILEVVFMPLRSYAGGYHASSERKCYFLSAGMIILDLFLLRFLSKGFHAGVGITLLLIAAAVIMWLAPVGNKNKPLDEDEKRVYGQRTHIVLLIELTIAILCYVFLINTIFWTMVLGILSVSISLIIGAYKNKLNLL